MNGQGKDWFLRTATIADLGRRPNDKRVDLAKYARVAPKIICFLRKVARGYRMYDAAQEAKELLAEAMGRSVR